MGQFEDPAPRRFCAWNRATASTARAAFSGISAIITAHVSAVRLRGAPMRSNFAGVMPVSTAVSTYNAPCFFNSAIRAVGSALADLEVTLAKPGPIGCELQVAFLLANLAKALGLCRAATARDHPERPALSDHDAEFQDLLLVRYFIFDFFHFVSFRAALGTGCPHRLQLPLKARMLSGAVV